MRALKCHLLKEAILSRNGRLIEEFLRKKAYEKSIFRELNHLEV